MSAITHDTYKAVFYLQNPLIYIFPSKIFSM